MKKIKELMDLSGRTALVTGGAGHIGLAVLEALMELGAKTVVWDIADGVCRARCEDLNSSGYGARACPFAVDLEDESAVRLGVRRTAETLGGIDIIVHSAALVGTTDLPGWGVPFKEQTLVAWDKAMKVNLSSAFIIAQEAEPFLKKSKKSSVILISSIHGAIAPDNRLYEGTRMTSPAAYGVSKAGLTQLARYLATTLAPEVRVNSIVSGGVWRGQDVRFHERYNERTPLGRMAVEEDLKGAVAYLASDLSAYVTGTQIVVDGGYTAW
ncbi:MAG: SDR family oxidoreductase [Candidatus Omnitrophica bacterium]|nr:SDR family oxidoreductase [Candidatus Omnitrophota bacterium]